jgi:hypothetical protein
VAVVVDVADAAKVEDCVVGEVAKVVVATTACAVLCVPEVVPCTAAVVPAVEAEPCVVAIVF